MWALQAGWFPGYINSKKGWSKIDHPLLSTVIGTRKEEREKAISPFSSGFPDMHRGLKSLPRIPHTIYLLSINIDATTNITRIATQNLFIVTTSVNKTCMSFSYISVVLAWREIPWNVGGPLLSCRRLVLLVKIFQAITSDLYIFCWLALQFKLFTYTFSDV